MRKSPQRLVKYLIGFSITFAAVSNCFNAISSSSSVTVSPLEASRIEQPNRDQHNLRITSSASPNRDAKLLESSRPAALSSSESLVGKSPAFALGATPFAPSVTATKSHTPSGSAQPGDTLTYTVVITNSGTSDATGVNFSDTIDPNTTLVPGSVIASPIAVDDSYHTIGNVNIQVPVGQGVIANDLNPNGSGTLTVTQVNSTPVPGGGSATTSTTNGSVTMSSDGSFTYNPNVAFRGPSDSFTYTLGNGTGKTDTATVTITVNGLIWFVNATAAPGGDGRLSTPFNCLVGSGCFDPVAADIANDNIFVYSGAYVGGLTLLNGQKLIGQGAGDTLLNITGLTAPSGTNMLPSTGGPPPTIAATGANITLGSGNTIRGVTLSGTAPAAVNLTGAGFGTATIAETALGGLGQALNLSGGTLTGPVASTAAFTSISSTNSSTTGISLTTVAGNMSSVSTSVTSSTGIGISISTSSATLNFGATTSTLSGGTGVSLTTNTGPITFGSLDISPAPTQRGLLATDNSNTITTASGTITTVGGTAIEITRSTGTTPLNTSLTSVSATGGANGIVLRNTSGSFTVNGDGTNTAVGGNGTGGTIANTSGADGAVAGSGVYLDNAQNVSLRRMTIQNHPNFGIRGFNVNALNLEYSRVNTTSGFNGTSTALDEGTVSFDNLTGTSNITNSIISDALEANARIVNTSGTLTLNVSGSTFSDTDPTNGLQGLLLQAGQNAGDSPTITANIITCTFSNNRARHIQTVANSAGRVDVNIGSSAANSGGTFTGMPAAMIDIGHNSTANSSFVVRNATFNVNVSPFASVPINVFNGSASGSATTFQGTIDSNSITAGNNSGFDGITLTGSGPGTFNAAVTNNTVTNVAGVGIKYTGAQSGASNTANLTIKHNTVTMPDPSASFGIQVSAAAANPASPTTVCAQIGGSTAGDKNTVHVSASPDIRVDARFVNSTMRLPGYAGGAQDTTAVRTFVSGNNITDTNTSADISASVGLGPGSFVGGAACTAPPPPPPMAPEFSLMTAQEKITQDDSGPYFGTLETTLAAARGKGTGENLPRLTQEELIWTVRAAIERLREARFAPEDLTRLEGVTFELDHLAEGQLAAINGTRVKIDETAAGFGWFFDQTANEDSEFDVPVPDRERQCTELSPAYGRMDLLTVVMRELVAVYLQGKDRVPKKLGPLMDPTLLPAVRRMLVFNLPVSTSRLSPSVTQSTNNQVAWAAPSLPKTESSTSLLEMKPAIFNPSSDVMPGSYGRSARRMSYATKARPVATSPVAPFSGETVTLSVGTIPPGESVTIMFQVTINNPLPSGVCSVTNQGHVTGSNFSPVDTNIDVTPIVKPVTIGACPANITTNNDPGVCTAVVTYTTPTADGCPAPTVVCNPPSGSAFAKGTTTVTCTASNGNPPDATCSFTVTVNDNQPPTITCPANVTQGTDPGQCSAVVTYANAIATDNCPGVGTPVCTPASGSTFAKGTTTVNCTVSDASGNSASCSFTVTVNDTTPPVITCPANVTQSTDPNQCSAVVTYTNATATDNCPGVGTPVCAPASGSTFAKGATTVNCTVSDSSGNSASCSFTVTVNDTQPPTITCPSNVAQSTDENQCSAVVNYSNATATDNCPGVGTPVCTPASGSTFAKGTTTVNCTVSDSSGNSASCSFTVTVNDTQAPTITCPANVTQGTGPGQCSAVVSYANATATDNCPGVGTPVCTPASGSTFPKGTTTVNCTVSDASANTANCSFTVTVNDTTPPSITCPANVEKSTDPNQCSAVVNYPNATATDNCSGVGTPVCTPASGSTFPKGVTTVTCTVSDASGNTASCMFTVTVKDTQPPTLGPCPSNTTVTSGGGCQVVTYTPPTATDNCGSATVSCSPPSGTCFPPGTTTVTCTASDDSPDSPDSTCSFTVTVVPCAITCPSNITTSSDSGQCGATVTFTPSSTPGCGTVTCTPSSGSFFPIGTTTVTCITQTGQSCTFTVTVTNDVAIASNFNGTAVAAGNFIWFNSVLDVTGLGSTPVTIRFFNQKVTSAAFTLTVPDAVVTFDPSATTATTTFNGVEWVTRVPSSGLAGNTFLSGLAYQLPANLPGGLNPVTWSGTLVSDTAGVQVNWKWAAAAYNNFSSNYNLLGVKPVDDNHASQYQNSDHAGTPENFKAHVIGGARGGGGSNYTGSYGGTKSVTPCVE